MPQQTRARLDGISVFLAGGAGFIGSHFVDRLLSEPATVKVTVYDNFSSGHRWHLSNHAADQRLNIVGGEVENLDTLSQAMVGHDTVIHLASNPDIARAAYDPDIDFRQGTLLTRNVAEAARLNHVQAILYASGSGVYGDLGSLEVDEDHGPLTPISTYGASKLAGEALLCSYAAMFEIKVCAFRFGNVIGPRQTHGVGYDFLRKLRSDPHTLAILGDGSQSKPYIHVTDVVEAVLLARSAAGQPFNVFNVATPDTLTVREIADLAAEALALDPETIDYAYSGGDRGWRGDVPVVRLRTERINALGWRCQRTSGEAMRQALAAMLKELEEGQHEAS
jgi:UDP-glucose 4-epimerase